MIIGLVGEAPNDTSSMKNLLEKRYTKGEYDFISLLDRIRGSNLDSQKTKRFLRIEFEAKKPDIVIFIRDLDGLSHENDKTKIRKQYFTQSNSVVNKKGIFLLHIYEIEALVLSDITTFNKIYNTNVIFDTVPMELEEPKEFLRKQTKKYTESDNADIFKEISFDTVMNCKYFEIFINKFDKEIERINNN